MTPENQIKLQKMQAVHAAFVTIERALDDGFFAFPLVVLCPGTDHQSRALAEHIETFIKGLENDN